MNKSFFCLAVVLFPTVALAQVLTTADILGAGKQAVMLSENHLYDTNVDLNIVYAMYVRGLTSKADLYVSLGETHILGQDQAFVGVGGNLKLFIFKGNRVSLFGVASVPLHRRAESCIVLLNPAVVVSRALNTKISLYSGLNALVRVGPHGGDLFTPLENKVNVPIGAAITLGNWGVYAEADFGRLKAIGVALSRTL